MMARKTDRGVMTGDGGERGNGMCERGQSEKAINKKKKKNLKRKKEA